jgi:hypothetical protein
VWAHRFLAVAALADEPEQVQLVRRQRRVHEKRVLCFLELVELQAADGAHVAQPRAPRALAELAASAVLAPLQQNVSEHLCSRGRRVAEEKAVTNTWLWFYTTLTIRCSSEGSSEYSNSAKRRALSY